MKSGVHSFFGTKSKSLRVRTSYSDNITASLALPNHLLFPSYPIHKLRNDVNNEVLLKKRIQSCRDLIVHHAANRVDLLFYSLAAFYKTNVVISKGRTKEQHGFGARFSDSVGCHSALFPNLIAKNKNHEPSNLIFADTHLGKSTNMTVEMPGLVNIFDNHLEGSTVVTSGICALNLVANNNVDLVTGMNVIFPSMNDFFNGYKNFIKNNKCMFPDILMLISDYQREGTFLAADGLKIKNEYVYLMLRIKPEDQGSMDASSLHHHCLKIQSEIWENKASYHPTIKKP